MQRRAIKLVVFALIVAGQHSDASAGSIIINAGNAAVGTWGPSPGGGTYGQSFKPTPGDNWLDEFLFYLNSEGTSFGFRAYVYGWNGSATVGDALYTSPVTTLVFSSPGVIPYVFRPAIPVAEGDSYIAVFSSEGIPGIGGGIAQISPGFPTSVDQYPDGAFFFTGAKPFTSAGQWSTILNNDLRFRADFSAVPEPATAALATVGLLTGLSLLRSVRHHT